MMIDVERESLIHPREVCRLQAFRTRGKPCHIAKVYRAFDPGALDANGSRIRLEKIRVPGGVRTSLEAVQRFCEALTDPDAAGTPEQRTRRQRQTSIARAQAELEACGL